LIQEKTDILIIGGGIAGCIAAISLADQYKVTLIDKRTTPLDRIGESLAPVAQRIFRQLNLCQNLNAEVETKLYRKNLGMQSYWGSHQVYIVDHMRNPDGMGLNLDRKEFEVYLRNVAEERGVHCLWGCRYHQSEYEDNVWKLIAKSSEEAYEITTDFVIDATGRPSHFTRSLGIERTSHDKLIACWMSLPNTLENQMSTISAGENGWWYSAVVPNNKRVIAFQTDADLVDRATFKTLESFLQLSEENKEITAILAQSNLEEIEFHGVTAANSTKLNQVAGQQWVALGDAAVSFDPLSSQGMYNAMASAMQLKELILKYGFTEELQQNYSLQIDDIWRYYGEHKNLFYQQERRWKDSTFWKRRQKIQLAF
jgi:flavin-dependent dehydrogenase